MRKTKAQLAFYKGKGTITDKIIKFWTKSKYSHVELIIKDEWYSTSPRIKTIQKRKLTPNNEHWDYIDIEVNNKFVQDFFKRTEGAKYDWAGIFLSQFLPLNLHSKRRWFCSEWVAEVTQIVNIGDGNKFSPGKLYNLITK